MNINFFNIEPTSLEDLRASLDEDDSVGLPDFFSILENHHDYLEESIKILVDPKASTFDKQENLSRFLFLLNMHAKSEETTLYRRLEGDEERIARTAGMGGQDEHDIASHLGDELNASGFEENWTDEIDAKAKVLASLVQNHINEEESSMFKVAKKFIEAEELDTLAREYIIKCRAFFEMGPEHLSTQGNSEFIGTRFDP